MNKSRQVLGLQQVVVTTHTSEIRKSKTLTDTGTVDDEFFEAYPTEDDFEMDERWDETEATDDADDLSGDSG